MLLWYRSTGTRTQLNRTGKVINKNVKCWNFNKTKPMCLPVRSCLNNRLDYCPVQQQIHATACCLSAGVQTNPHICKDQSKPTVLTQRDTHTPTHTNESDPSKYSKQYLNMMLIWCYKYLTHYSRFYCCISSELYNASFLGKCLIPG